MNALLLSLGTAIALALIAAFAAPFFVDWSAQRGFFEERVSEVLGRPVQFAGDLDVRVVPFPSLTATDVRIGEGAEPDGEGADRLVLRAALAPLLSGELHVSELVLTRPRATFEVDAGGRVHWSAAAGDAWLPLPLDRTRIERFEAVDGTFVLDDARGGRHELTQLNLTGSATSLAGPFRIEGSAVAEGGRYHARLATGAVQSDGSMRLTGSVTPAEAPGVDLDGWLRLAGAATAYEGDVAIAGLEADRPWRIEGTVAATVREAAFEALALQIGPEERRMSLSGAATVSLAPAPRFDAQLAARRLDLDRSFGGTPDEPLALAEIADRLMELWGGTRLPMPGRLAVEAGSIVTAGNLIENLALDVEIDGADWRVRQADVEAPGGSAASFAGDLRFDGVDPHIDGTLRLESERAGMLSGWLFGDDARIPGLDAVTGPLAARAAVSLADGALELDAVEIETAGTRLEGVVAYAAATDETRGRLAARIATDRLEIGTLRRPATGHRAGELWDLAARTDFEIELAAATLRAGPLELDEVDLALALEGGELRIERLHMRGPGETLIAARGAVSDPVGAPDGTLAVDVETDSPSGLAEVLAALELPAAAEALRARADALAPLRLALEIEARRTAEDSIQARLGLGGTAGESRIEAGLDFAGRLDAIREGDVEATLAVAAQSGAGLGEQLGLFSFPADGAAHVALDASGRPGETMAFDIVASGLGIDGEAAGDLRLGADWSPAVEARLALEVSDPAGLLDGIGITLARGGGLPMTLDGRLSAESGVWRLTDVVLAGRELQAQGDLTVNAGGTAPSFSGSFELDRIGLPWLLATALGPEAFSIDGEGDAAVWPEASFAPVDWGEWRGRLRLAAPTLDLGGDLQARSAALDVSFDSRRLRLDDIAGDMFGGRLSGAADIAVEGGSAQLEGRIELSDARLEEIVWRSSERPVATGRLTVGAEASGRGRSLRGVVSSLAGDGAVQIEEGVLRRLNPAAFDQIVQAVDAGLELAEEQVRETFAAHLDAGSLRFERAEGALSIASGVARISNARFDTARVDSFASASIDLTELGLESDWTLQVAGEGPDGRTREVGLLFTGPLASPSRQIDVAPLIGYLTVRAFEREVERLEELQDEILRRHQLNQDIDQFSRAERRHEQAIDARAAAEAEAEAEAQRAAEAEAQAAAEAEGDGGAGLRRLIEQVLRETPEDGTNTPPSAPAAPEQDRGPLVITPPAARE